MSLTNLEKSTKVYRSIYDVSWRKSLKQQMPPLRTISALHSSFTYAPKSSAVLTRSAKRKSGLLKSFTQNSEPPSGKRTPPICTSSPASWKKEKKSSASAFRKNPLPGNTSSGRTQKGETANVQFNAGKHHLSEVRQRQHIYCLAQYQHNT